MFVSGISSLKRNKYVAIGVVAMSLLFASVAWAEIVFEGGEPLQSLPATISVTSADGVTKATTVRPRLVGTENVTNGVIYVSPTASVSGATATFEVDLYQRTAGVDVWIGTSYVQQLTFSSTRTVSGRYTLDQGLITVDPAMANVYCVRVTQISSGNIQYRSWCGTALDRPGGSSDE